MNLNASKIFLELQSELLNFRLKDPLVSLNHTTSLFIINNTIKKDTQFLKLRKNAKSIENETGINPLCICKGIVNLEIGDLITETPIQIIDINSIIDSSIENSEFIKGEHYANPFLIDFLNKNYNANLTSDSNPTEINRILTNLDLKCNYEVEYLGNFHPFRHELLKDIYEVGEFSQSSYPLSKILGIESEPTLNLTLNFEEVNLFNLDHWQSMALEELKNNSIVVQGPPGTGKSQLISNVTARTIANQNSLLIVSEKRAALEVIKSKFQDKNLDYLCFINSSQKKSKDVILDLKKTWDIFLSKSYTPLSSNKHKSTFEIQLNKFISDNSNNKFSFIAYFEEQNKLSFKKIEYLSDCPNICEWEESQIKLNQLNERDFKLFKYFNFNNFTIYLENFQKLFKSIGKYKNLAIKFNINSWPDFIATMKKAAVFQQFNSEIYSKHKQIIGQKSKQFKKLRTSLQESIQNLQFLKEQNSDWLETPTLTELEFLKNSFLSESFLGKLKWKKTWKKWSRTPEANVKKQLISMEKQLLEEIKLNKIKKSLFQLGIEKEYELELIHGILITIDNKTWEEFNNTPEIEIESLLNIHSELNEVYQLLKNLFDFSNDTDINEYFSLITGNTERFSFLITLLQGLNKNLINLIKKSSDFTEAKAIVYKSAWINYTFQNPEFLRFNFNQFLIDAESNLIIEEKNQYESAIELANKQLQIFQEYHELILTPNSKLSETQKEFKSSLKIGKAILVKEFGKQRKHLTLRQLFHSEAKHWLKIIKPVWLTNPIALATLFPAEKEMFDLVIFDEASQIPLSHSIGALHRAKRVLIAGDNQQMGPSSFFTRKNENVTDVLHQASYYFKNITLCGHYRSKNKALIDFSNRHFYHNQLEVFEEFNTTIKNPVSFCFIENGIYNENKNQIEAKEVAKFIHSQLKKVQKIGVVAFSETQLAAIYNSLDADAKKILDERIENNTLFFKSLEHVQGDECDHLIISFGYGFNPEGKFEMHFGPLNKSNGDKRLNVLFSRSREQITFFASIKSNDFKYSDNRAIQLLRQWFLQIEKPQTEKLKQNDIYFEDLIFSSKSLADFTTKFRVYRSRNWNIKSKYHDFPSRLGTGS